MQLPAFTPSPSVPIPPAELPGLLEDLYHHFSQPAFIAPDPVSIPHRYTRREDIEIAGFLAATIAWGNRLSVLGSGSRLLTLMDQAPADFIHHSTPTDWARADRFVHRTFNGHDVQYFFRALQHLYRHHGGLMGVVTSAVSPTDEDASAGLIALRQAFFSLPDAPARTGKHVSDLTRNAAGKRLWMFLRWMVRKDSYGVDFGLWPGILPRQLLLPLDVHTGRVARTLGLLQRKANDLHAARAVTARLRLLDGNDPAKYDFALFGLGVSGWLKPSR